jgi:hypothetical protein
MLPVTSKRPKRSYLCVMCRTSETNKSLDIPVFFFRSLNEMNLSDWSDTSKTFKNRSCIVPIHFVFNIGYRLIYDLTSPYPLVAFCYFLDPWSGIDWYPSWRVWVHSCPLSLSLEIFSSASLTFCGPHILSTWRITVGCIDAAQFFWRFQSSIFLVYRSVVRSFVCYGGTCYVPKSEFAVSMSSQIFDHY